MERRKRRRGVEGGKDTKKRGVCFCPVAVLSIGSDAKEKLENTKHQTKHLYTVCMQAASSTTERGT